VLRLYKTTHYTDGDNTTQQLGAGTFITPNGGMDTDGVISAITFAGSDEVELEFLWQAVGLDFSTGHTIEWRVAKADGTALDSYTNTPSGSLSNSSLSLLPSSIASGETFYAPTVEADDVIAPAFIPSAEVVYSPTIDAGATISPTFIASEETHYAPQVDQAVTAGFIASEETFYTPTITSGATIAPSFIASEETHYTPQVDQTITAAFLASAEAFYTPSIGHRIHVSTRIESDEAFYVPSIGLTIAPTRIESGETFWVPTVSADGSIHPVFIASGEAFYLPTVGAGDAGLVAIEETGCARAFLHEAHGSRSFVEQVGGATVFKEDAR